MIGCSCTTLLLRMIVCPDSSNTFCSTSEHFLKDRDECVAVNSCGHSLVCFYVIISLMLMGLSLRHRSTNTDTLCMEDQKDTQYSREKMRRYEFKYASTIGIVSRILHNTYRTKSCLRDEAQPLFWWVIHIVHSHWRSFCVKNNKQNSSLLREEEERTNKRFRRLGRRTDRFSRFQNNDGIGTIYLRFKIRTTSDFFVLAFTLFLLLASSFCMSYLQ